MKITKEKITKEITYFCDICGRKISIEDYQMNRCEICGREHCNYCHDSSHISNLRYLRYHHDKKILIGVCSICKSIDKYYIKKIDRLRNMVNERIQTVKNNWKITSLNKLSVFEKQKSEEITYFCDIYSREISYDKLFKSEEYEETKDKEYKEYEEIKDNKNKKIIELSEDELDIVKRWVHVFKKKCKLSVVDQKLYDKLFKKNEVK